MLNNNNTVKFIGKHIKTWLRNLTSSIRILLYAHRKGKEEKNDISNVGCKFYLDMMLIICGTVIY